MEIISQLQNLGLSKKTALAYTSLLRLQFANPYQISKAANIERTTIYTIMEELVDKGLASKSRRGKRNWFVAEPPLKLKQLIQKQELTFESILPSLLSLQGLDNNKPIIKFYDDREGIRQAFLASLEAHDKVHRHFIAVDNLIELVGLRFAQNYINKRVAKGVKVLSLRPKSRESSIADQDWYLKRDNKEVFRDVRYLDLPVNFDLFILVYDHVVTIISSKKECYALTIESPEYSQAMKLLFDIAWASSVS